MGSGATERSRRSGGLEVRSGQVAGAGDLSFFLQGFLCLAVP